MVYAYKMKYVHDYDNFLLFIKKLSVFDSISECMKIKRLRICDCKSILVDD